MMPDHRDDSYLDAAIDRAVRDLMSAEPRADLRARVLAELGGGSTGVAVWPRWASASAALALLFAIATMVLLPPGDRRERTQVVAVQPSAATRETLPARPPQTVGTPAPGARGGNAAATTRRGTSKPPTTIDRPIQAASIDSTEAVAVEPLSPVERLRPIEPIRIASLGAIGVSTSEIVINSIPLEPVEIMPLSPRR